MSELVSFDPELPLTKSESKPSAKRVARYFRLDREHASCCDPGERCDKFKEEMNRELEEHNPPRS